MEPLLIPVSIQTEEFELGDSSVMSGEGKVCPSPMSSFGSDFNSILFPTSNGHEHQFLMKTDFMTDELNKEGYRPVSENLQGPNKNEKKMASESEIRNDEADELNEDEDVTDTHVKIVVFATNSRKSDLTSEKEKYFFNIKSRVKHKKCKKNKTEAAKKNCRDVTSEYEFLNVSLFPRPSREITADNYEIDKALEQFYATENELDELENMIVPFNKELDMEGNLSNSQKYPRADRNRKIQKAHKQIKDKHCKSVRNNEGRKRFYVHHRVYKLMELEFRRISYMPSKTLARLNKTREELRQIRHNTPQSNKAIRSTNRSSDYIAPRAGNQSLAHALDNHNAASDLDGTLVNVLIALQHRDLTPEDYEVLLQLDDSLAPKTLDENIVESFKTDTVDQQCVDETCAICMDQYQIGQSRKFLPCNHVFHASCIEMWLKNSSMNCPIDNLPLDVSNR